MGSGASPAALETQVALGGAAPRCAREEAAHPAWAPAAVSDPGATRGHRAGRPGGRTPQGARRGTVLEACQVAAAMPGLWRAIALETLLGKSRRSCRTLTGLVPRRGGRAVRRGPAPGMEMLIEPWTEGREGEQIQMEGPRPGSSSSHAALALRGAFSALISCSPGP